MAADYAGFNVDTVMALIHENSPKDDAQLRNELKVIGMEVGLRVNSDAQKVEFTRLELSNQCVFDLR